MQRSADHTVMRQRTVPIVPLGIFPVSVTYNSNTLFVSLKQTNGFIDISQICYFFIRLFTKYIRRLRNKHNVL